MKTFICIITLMTSYAVHSSENFKCLNNKISLSINVAETSVTWVLKYADDESINIEDHGNYTKESDSADAFSSIGEQGAISYKNNKAVFVFPTDSVIYFPLCQKN